MKIIDRYLISALIRGVGLIFLLLIGLFSFFELAQQLNMVGRGSFESTDAIRMVGFSLPRLAIDVLPVTCMLGCIIGLGQLANNQELTILRASGMSVARLTRPLLWLVAGLTILVLTLQQFVIPEFSRQASILLDKASESGSGQRQDYWTRSATNLIRVGEIEFGNRPRDIEIYEMDGGKISRIIEAENADVIESNQWLLHQVRTTTFNTDGKAAVVSLDDQQIWQSRLTAEQIYKFILADFALSPLDLYRYIGHLAKNNLDAHRYQVMLWQQISLPIGLIAMSLLGIPFIMGSLRRIPIGTRITLGSSIGVLFFLGQRTFTQVGLLYQLPAAAVGLIPVCLMFFFALWGISRSK